MVSVCTPSHPLLTAGPSLVVTDNFGNVTIPIYSCSPVEMHWTRNELLRGAKNDSEFENNEINPEFINSIRKQMCQDLNPLT